MKVRTLVIMLSAVGCAVSISACTPAEEPAPLTDSTSVPVATASSSPAASSSSDPTAPKPEAKKPAAKKSQASKNNARKKSAARKLDPRLLNPSFEKRGANGAPEHWNVSNIKNIAASTDAYHGVHVLALTSESEDYGIVVQPVKARKNDLGKVFVASAMGKAPKPGQLFLELLYKAEGKTTKNTVSWPASTEWTQLESKLPLPKTIDADSLRLKIMIRPGGKDKYLVDNVSVRIE